MNLNRKLTLSAARPSQLIVLAICLVSIVLNSCGHSGSDSQASDLQAKEGADKFCALVKPSPPHHGMNPMACKGVSIENPAHLRELSFPGVVARRFSVLSES